MRSRPAEAVHHESFQRHVGEVGVVVQVNQDLALLRPAKTFEQKLNRHGKLAPGPHYAIAWGSDQTGPAFPTPTHSTAPVVASNA